MQQIGKWLYLQNYFTCVEKCLLQNGLKLWLALHCFKICYCLCIYESPCDFIDFYFGQFYFSLLNALIFVKWIITVEQLEELPGLPRLHQCFKFCGILVVPKKFSQKNLIRLVGYTNLKILTPWIFIYIQKIVNFEAFC